MSSIYQRDGVWQIQIHVKGRKRPLRRSLGTRSEVKAKQRQAEIDAVYAGGNTIEKENVSPCLMSSWEKPYRQWAKDKIEDESVENTIRYLNEWIALTGLDDLSQIQTEDVEDCIAKLRKKNKPGTINLKFSLVAGYVDRCGSSKPRSLKLHALANPFKIEPLRTVKRHVRWLQDPRDVRKLLDAAFILDEELYLAIALCLYAGLRKGEADAAEWSWINWHATPPLLNVVNCDDEDDGFQVKDRTDRSVPLCDDLIKILEPRKRDSGYILWPERDYDGCRYRNNFSERVTMLAKSIELPMRVAPHLLRHTFASRLASAGVSLLEIGKYLGHSDPKLTYSTYAHLAPSSESINKLNL